MTVRTCRGTVKPRPSGDTSLRSRVDHWSLTFQIEQNSMDAAQATPKAWTLHCSWSTTFSLVQTSGQKSSYKSKEKSTSKEKTLTLNAAILGSVAGFPEQLFWGDCGLGLCSEVQGEAWPEFWQSLSSEGKKDMAHSQTTFCSKWNRWEVSIQNQTEMQLITKLYSLMQQTHARKCQDCWESLVLHGTRIIHPSSGM